MNQFKQQLDDVLQKQIIWFLARIYVNILLLKRRQLAFGKRVEKEVVWTLAKIYVFFLKKRNQWRPASSIVIRIPINRMEFRRVLAFSLTLFLLMPILPMNPAIADAGTYTILNNDRLRFGSGSENSVNTAGNLEEPYYYNQTNGWRQLTYGQQALSSEIGEGGTGTNWYNRDGSSTENPVLSNQVIDISGFTPTSDGAKGYGKIISTGTVTINGKILEVKNTYELPESKAYLKVTTQFKNLSESDITNLRYWVGAPDDYVGGSDVNKKEKGNLVDGKFVLIANKAVTASALQVSSGSEAILFYTDTPKANLIVGDSWGWDDIQVKNPFDTEVTVNGDNGYAFYVRFNDLAPNTSDQIVWYYAAGELEDIANIVSDVAAATGSARGVSYRSMDYKVTSVTSGTGYYLLVPRDATAPTTAEIEAGVSYGAVTVVSSSTAAITANTEYTFPIDNLAPGTVYDLYFVVKTAETYSEISKTQFTTRALSGPSTPRNISVSIGNGQATVSFDPPEDDGGSSVTEYIVTANPGNITASGIASPIMVSGLNNGTAYTFSVQAVNEISAGTGSPSSGSKTPILFAGGAPTNVLAESGNGQATVSFNKPEGIGDTLVTYTVAASPGGITASGIASPITVKGLTNGTAYTFTVVATDGTETSPISTPSPEVIPAAPVPANKAPSVQSLVKIEGASLSPGTVQISNTSGVKTAAVDATSAIATKVQQLIDALKADTPTTPTSPSTGTAPVLYPDPAREVKIDLTRLGAEKVDVKLTADIVEEMGANDMTLNVINGQVSHLIPAKDLDVSDITRSMGLAGQPEMVEIKILIQSPLKEVVQQMEERASISGVGIVLPPMDFEVKAVNLETKEENTIKRFTDYVGRVFEIPKGVDPSKITTGIVLNADGTFSHVPTVVLKSGGTYYARINSLTNSTYSVIWNPFAFADLETHWVKEAANNLGARLIVSGDETGSLNPDETIRRGEFISMLTKALGIYRTGAGRDQFTDVTTETAEYDSISIAKEYGLLSGYPDGTFRPDNKMTRQEMIVVLAKAASLLKLEAINQKTMQDYLDSMQLAIWARPYLDQNIKTGIVVGNSGRLRPTAYVTMAEALSAMERLLINSGLIN